MTQLEFRPLTHAHERQMHAINRACPIEADFTLFFERTPSFFRWPDSVFDSYVYIGGFRGDELVGYILFAAMSGNAGPYGSRVSYTGDARVLPSARGHAFVEAASRAILEVLPAEPAGFSMIKRGNSAMRGALAKMRIGDLEITDLCGFDAAIVLMLRPMGGARRYRVRRASEQDIPAIAGLMERAFDDRLFAPFVTPDELRRDLARLPGLSIRDYYLAFSGDELVGTLGAWDADPLRRATVLRSSWRGELLRAAYAVTRRVLHSGAPLPGPEDSFHAVTTTRVAIPSGDPSILRDLVAVAHDDHLGLGFHMLLVGLTGDDPLASGLRGMPVQHFRSDVLLSAPPPNVTALRAMGRPYVDLRVL